MFSVHLSCFFFFLGHSQRTIFYFRCPHLSGSGIQTWNHDWGSFFLKLSIVYTYVLPSLLYATFAHLHCLYGCWLCVFVSITFIRFHIYSVSVASDYLSLPFWLLHLNNFSASIIAVCLYLSVLFFLIISVQSCNFCDSFHPPRSPTFFSFFSLFRRWRFAKKTTTFCFHSAPSTCSESDPQTKKHSSLALKSIANSRQTTTRN